MIQPGTSSEPRSSGPALDGTADPSTLIVGIGSAHGDDQVGWRVAEQLDATLDLKHVAVRKATSPTQLLDWLDGVERLVICDACHGLGRVGMKRCWKWPTREIGVIGWSGTHDLSLPATLSLAERLGRLPKEVTVWAIEAREGGTAECVSTTLAEAIPDLVDNIVRDLLLKPSN